MSHKPVSFIILCLLIGCCYLVRPTWAQDRMYNGHPISNKSDYPYVAALINNNGRFICGGTLISDSVILTSAHCIEFVDEDKEFKLSVRFQSLINDTDFKIIKVSSKIIHEKYSEIYVNKGREYDIGLIFLESSVDVLKYGKPIALPYENILPDPGTMAIVLGRGKTEKGDRSKELREIEVPIVSESNCLKAYPGHFAGTIFCAGYFQKGGKDACDGDSGGPLVVNNQLVGIVSYGDECAKSKFPGVYINVAMFQTWIRNKIIKIYN